MDSLVLFKRILILGKFKLNHDNHSNGFTVVFDNGYTISVQFGKFSYCNNNDLKIDYDLKEIPKALDCENAEIAIMYPGGGFIPWKEGDDVHGYTTPNEVSLLMMYISTIQENDIVEIIDMNKIRANLAEHIRPVLEEGILLNV